MSLLAIICSCVTNESLLLTVKLKTVQFVESHFEVWAFPLLVSLSFENIHFIFLIVLRPVVCSGVSLLTL